MFLSGLIMVTRNRFVFLNISVEPFPPLQYSFVLYRFIAWPAALFGINQVVNAHPLRKQEGGTGWSNFAYVSFFSVAQNMSFDNCIAVYVFLPS